jgi:hypothetical protein
MSPQPLRPYDATGCCPKCANGVIGTAYHEDSTLCETLLIQAKVKHAGLGEHLCRTCDRCGFTWPEATLDEAERR